MQREAVLVLVLVWCTQTVHAQQGIWLTLNSVNYTNNSVVNIMNIGTGSAALICTTTNLACCLSTDGSHWYFPDGSTVQRTSTTYYRTRTVNKGIVGTVSLNRNPGATTTGVFHCDIPDASGDLQSLYVGIYTATTGSPHVTNLTYDNQTFTCTSTGGPATTVTWRRNGSVITLNTTHQQIKRLVDPVVGTYQTVLTIDPSVDQNQIVGTYNCTVKNARGRSSRILVATTPTGPPLGFRVTQQRSRNMTFSWSLPAPTLRNGVITGYSLSCVPEVGTRGRNTISMQYTAAGTFTLGGFTPATSYNCSISANNIWGSGPVAYRMVSTLDDSMVFQLQLSGLPSTCQMWVLSDTSAKLSDVIAAVVQNTDELCQCGFNAEYITDYALQCFPNSDQQVTFRARLHGTAHANSSQLTEDIQQWINTEMPVAVQGVRINIDTCPVAITSFQDPQCPETTQPTSGSTTTETTTAVIVGGVIAGMIVLILPMTVIVIAVLVTKNHKFKYSADQDVGKQPHNWSGVTESSTAGMTTTQCEAYRLTKLGQEYEVVSEPDHDAIPTIKGKQEQGQQDYENNTTPPSVSTLQKICGKVEEA